MYSYSVSFAGGKMASASGKAKDGGVTEEQLKAVEYELLRSKTIEQNDKRLAAVRATRASMQEDMEANQAPKKKRKVCSFHHIHVLPEGSKCSLQH